MKLKISNVDIPFLVSILLITQSALPIKIVGLVLLIIFSPTDYLRTKLAVVQFYYLAMFLLSLVYGFFYLWSGNYFAPYLLVLFFWGSAYIVLTHILGFLNRNTEQKIDATLNAYFACNAAVVFFNFVAAVFSYGTINIYEASPAAGDLITGIYPTSSVNMIVCALFLVYFIYKRYLKLGLIALLIILLTGFMSGIVLFIASVAMAMFFYARFPFFKKLLFLCGLGLIMIFFYYFSESNFNYAFGYIDRVIRMENDAPFKIVSFVQTLDYWLSGVKSFILGAGPANFSSRVAFTVSGEYVSWYPEALEYKASVFKKNHLWIWTRDFGNIWDNRNSTANQPFSFYNQVIGEYGLLGLLTFLIFYVMFWANNIRYMTYGRLLFPMILSFFILDYWLEYLNVIIVYELLMFHDLAKHKI